jgi:galactose oxidase
MDPTRRAVCITLAFLAFALPTGKVEAQVTEVIVGITPSCPYGIGACWSGAYEALGTLGGIKSVSEAPDAYNCTARVYLKESALPEVSLWAEQFKSRVGRIYEFRGAEVTVLGTLETRGDGVLMRVPGVAEPIPLEPLRAKLQWNFRKARARQPEPDEKDAYQQLVQKKNTAGSEAFKVQVTGPLEKTGAGFSIQVREFFPMATPGDLYGRP